MGLGTSYSAPSCLLPLGLFTRGQCSAASGRPAHYRALEQPAEPQHAPYVHAGGARVDHTAPTLHPRTRGVHTERLRSRASDPCIPARPPHGVTRPRADTTHATRHDDAREVHAGRSWGGRTVRDDHPRSQGHRLGVVFASSHRRLSTLFIPHLKHTSSTRSRAAALGSGARRAVRAPVGDAAAPFRWRTGSMDGGSSCRSFVGPSRLVELCHG